VLDELAREGALGFWAAARNVWPEPRYDIDGMCFFTLDPIERTNRSQAACLGCGAERTTSP
jgi:hypothetical protein